MPKTVVILQSNYIPWKGYFDLMAAADEFIVFDDMQYTRRDWRNRNQIKTPQGLQWLTVPVQVKGRYHQRVRDTLIDGDAWAVQHWRALMQNYARAPYFERIANWLEPLYLARTHTHISMLNRTLMDAICAELGMDTRVTDSSDYSLTEGKTQRLVDLCLQAGASRYLSGPAARDYIDPELFERAGIELAWFDYSGYDMYPQLHGAFTHHVSIVDLLFNCGPAARDHLKWPRR